MSILEKLEEAVQEKEGQGFAKALLATKRVAYDWEADVVWVWDGEKLGEGSPVYMHGHIFLQNLHDSGHQFTNGGTAAGLVTEMLALDIDVRILAKELFEDDYLDTLIEIATHMSESDEIGEVTQGVLTYAKNEQ